MVTGLVTELKSFDATEEAPKGIMGFFRKATNSLDTFKAKYAKVETNVDKIEAVLEGPSGTASEGYRHAGQNVRDEPCVFQGADDVHSGR